jgi:hypothetical protein
MAKPARLHILERARALIKDEGHWCPSDLARDAWGFSISPIDRDAEQRCALGALLAAAYELTGDFDRAQKVAAGAMRSVIGATRRRDRLQVFGSYHVDRSIHLPKSPRAIGTSTRAQQVQE